MYSQLKPAWHSDRIDALRRGEPIMPVHVHMVLSDLCNQDCSFCAYRMSAGLSHELFKTADTTNPNRKIPTEKALDVVAECSRIGVKAIQFTGGGEPTVHPDHLSIFRYAQEVGLKTALVTNGVKLDPRHDSILDMTWIRISIDSGNAASYARIRRTSQSSWRKVWNNIEILATGYDGVLGVGFVVTPDNFTEIGDCAAMCKNAGVSNMRVGAVFSKDGIGYYRDRIEQISETIEEVQNEHDTDDFEIVDLFGRRLGDLESGSPDESFCGYQYFTAYIGGDQYVYRCCNTAYTPVGRVGDLRKQTLEEIYSNPGYFDARRCVSCQFLGQNAAINALIDEPLHPEFV